MSKRAFVAWLTGPAHDIVARADDGRPITRRDFARDVLCAARALVGLDGQRIAIDEGHPYRFSVLLNAVLWSGCTPVLFPGRGAQFEALKDAYDAVLVDASDGVTVYPKLTLVVKMDAEPLTIESLTKPDATRPIRLFTSGSSGTPKCIEKTVGLMDREAEVTTRLFGAVTEGAVVQSTVDPRHLYGLTFNIWFAFSAGRPIATTRRVYQEQLLTLPHPVALITTPTFMRMLETTLAAPVLPFVLSAGGPLSDEAKATLTAWSPSTIYEIYGSTETGVVASRAHESNALANAQTPDWTLIDEAMLSETADGWVLTSPLLPTGVMMLDDQLKLTGERTFHLLGRRDRVVKIGEVRLSLTEIERVVERTLGLVIRALPVVHGERTLIGAVVNEALSPKWTGQLPDRRAVTQALHGTLDPLARPRLWRSVPDWPMNAQGKVETQRLLELFHV
ncbi:MAG: acyl-CoA synthetase [Sutterella wadsworthensis]|nr:acyl-CoA synthetase [Sutterella wadsworthensis]